MNTAGEAYIGILALLPLCLLIHVLTHTTKVRLKHSGLIIMNLFGRGNQTPDHCYNDIITIMPLTQTSCCAVALLAYMLTPQARTLLFI